MPVLRHCMLLVCLLVGVLLSGHPSVAQDPDDEPKTALGVLQRVLTPRWAGNPIPDLKRPHNHFFKGKTWKILIISDTHLGKDPSPGPVPNLPKADILIHCGDLSDHGEIAEYQKIYDIMAKHPARIKLAIGGNHDYTLDRKGFPGLVQANKPYLPADAKDPANTQSLLQKARSLWKSQAKRTRIQFLDHGFHVISLAPLGIRFKKSLTIYSSPIQVIFNGGEAFQYTPGKDPDPYASWTQKADVIISHGPPAGHFDQPQNAKNPAILDPGFGSVELWNAVQRVKPAFMVFGHNHPPKAMPVTAQYWNWASGSGKDITHGPEDTPAARVMNITSEGVTAKYDNETLIINASLMSANNQLEYPPTMIKWAIEKRSHADARHAKQLAKQSKQAHMQDNPDATKKYSKEWWGKVGNRIYGKFHGPFKTTAPPDPPPGSPPPPSRRR